MTTSPAQDDRRRECKFHGPVFSVGWHEANGRDGETLLICAECEARRRYHEAQLGIGFDDTAPAYVALLALQWPEQPEIPERLLKRWKAEGLLPEEPRP